jgi:hypothetical protein
MLRSVNDLTGLTIGATDGDIGSVKNFYFDDQHWTIRYLVVDTGGWLSGRRVLISPFAIRGLDAAHDRLLVNLTKTQVERSPDIDTHRPMSREAEIAFSRYYGYPYYWPGPFAWGADPYPIFVPPPSEVRAEVQDHLERQEVEDQHLRSTAEVGHYDIHAVDGDIGHVHDFLIDDRSWTIRYPVVDTRNWWPGKKVLISPAWIQEVSWARSSVFVGLTRDTIRNAPEYNPDRPIDREYEDQLYGYYGRPRYWSDRPAA